MATAIILGRLVLQGLGWGFFAAVKYRRQIPLPFSSAVWVKNNTHSVTHITTLIATFLSGFSTLYVTIYQSGYNPSLVPKFMLPGHPTVHVTLSTRTNVTRNFGDKCEHFDALSDVSLSPLEVAHDFVDIFHLNGCPNIGVRDHILAILLF
jgi:hypothetical protein